MGGYMKGLEKQAYGIGNQAGSMYDQAMGNAPAGAGKVASGASADPTRGGGKVMGTGPGFSQYMGMAQAPDMSRPQQGQDIMSLMSMLQGGQMQRGRRY